jgi:hypothetical protein
MRLLGAYILLQSTRVCPTELGLVRVDRKDRFELVEVQLVAILQKLTLHRELSSRSFFRLRIDNFF